MTALHHQERAAVDQGDRRPSRDGDTGALDSIGFEPGNKVIASLKSAISNGTAPPAGDVADPDGDPF